MWREDRSSLRCAKGAKNLALLRNAALAILPFEQHGSLNAAFDHYRDYRGGIPQTHQKRMPVSGMTRL